MLGLRSEKYESVFQRSSIGLYKIAPPFTVFLTFSFGRSAGSPRATLTAADGGF